MRRVCGLVVDIAFILAAVPFAQGQQRNSAFDEDPHYPSNGDDLYAFVSRPDLRPPKFNVEVYEPNKIAAGYWFVAPYENLGVRLSTKLYEPAQIGPHIYDGNGELVWSGASLFEHATSFDFKTAMYKHSPALTFILRPDQSRRNNADGGGVILDSTLEVQKMLLQASGHHAPNMHEFTVTKQGTALMITAESLNLDPSKISAENNSSSDQEKYLHISDNGFREMDIRSGHSFFEWWARDHIDISSSPEKPPVTTEHVGAAWDWFHLNSIDKNQDGDYLISSRHLSTIYKISGQNGSILWQLGGRASSFTPLNDFTFSYQHDARFRHENSTHTTISFLNNAANDLTNTSTTSTAVTVILDTKSKTATRLASLPRPDGRLSRLRGNAQHLANGNTFVCWSENSLLSEFDHTGALLMQANFASARFVTYRAYKSTFTARPAEPIAVKAFVYGADEPGRGAFTAVYVSWNGATDVAVWMFYSGRAGDDDDVVLGETAKTGFETVFMVAGVHCELSVEGLSENGVALGRSAIHKSTLPASWSDVECSRFDAVSDMRPSKDLKQDGLLRDVAATGAARVQLVLGCCVAALLLGLGAAAWQIQRLNLRLRDRSSYEYTRLDKE